MKRSVSLHTTFHTRSYRGVSIAHFHLLFALVYRRCFLSDCQATKLLLRTTTNLHLRCTMESIEMYRIPPGIRVLRVSPTKNEISGSCLCARRYRCRHAGVLSMRKEMKKVADWTAKRREIASSQVVHSRMNCDNAPNH